jgi:hypothetical protein
MPSGLFGITESAFSFAHEMFVVTMQAEDRLREERAWPVW